MAKLKVLCIGTGAIGTYIGGSLMLSGHQVVFLQRPENPEKINQFKLNFPSQIHILPQPEIVTSISEAVAKGPYDFALFALKSFDTRPALDKFSPYSEHLPPFLCLQNGVENESYIDEILGENRVIPATVTSAVGKSGMGEISLEKLRGIGIDSNHPLSGLLKQTFNQANLNVDLINQPVSMKWSKMLTNLVSNASSAILSISPGEVFSHRELFNVEMAQLRETLAVMRAKSIPVIDLPGTPVRLLAAAVKFVPHFIAQPLLKNAVVGGRGDKMPSFYIDLQAGRPHSEVEYLNGAVVRAGAEVNIPTPVNDFLTKTLMRMVNGEIPKGKYKNNTSIFLKDFSKSIV